MNVRIITDSASDFTCKEALEKGIDMIPLKTRFGSREYLDGVEISGEQFYEMLENADELPTTSQPSPFDYERVFLDVLQKGEEAVVITVSSRLSGTHQSARLAASPYENRVWVVDSENVTIGQRILVEYALQLRNEGKSAAQIVKSLEEIRGKVCLLGMLETLEYLVKGGRISKMAGFAGTMLNIKPVLTLEEGNIKMLGKARGSRQSNNFLNETIANRGGIDFAMPICLAYSGTDDALLKGYVQNSQHLWLGMTDNLPVSTIGSTIGTHVGPGAIAVAFFVAE